MFPHTIRRLLLVGFLVALIGIGVNSAPVAAASPSMAWSDTESRTEVLVQACTGFDITSDYTADRAFQLTSDPTGDGISERRDVSFTGALGNAATGLFYAYDGHFTRTSSPNLGEPSITDLSLQLELGTPGELTVSLARVDLDMADSPPSVIHALMSNVLRMDLCSLLDGPSTVGATDIAAPNSRTGSESCDVVPLKGFTC
jgi:hypothetical protein